MTEPRKRGRGRPLAANGDETRLRIMHAARSVFSERGYDGATVQAIAASAGLTRLAINHYFPSKWALYRAVLHATNEAVLAASIKRAELEITLVDRLTTLISAAVSTNPEKAAGAALLITGIYDSQRHPEWKSIESDSVPISREFLMRVVNHAIDRREVASDIDVRVLVETLMVVLCGVVLYAGYAPNPEEISGTIEMVWQLLESGLRPTESK